jgi:hypothetical protein
VKASMNGFRLLTYLATALFLVACQGRGYTAHDTITHALTVQEFSLSAQSPVNREHGIRLVSIAGDGTTTIETTDTHRRLSAAPGKPFVSEEFGREGLVLDRASFRDQSASFSRFVCITSSR